MMSTASVSSSLTSSRCCKRLEVFSTSMSISGQFERNGVWSDRPVYWSRDTNLFLYYLPMRVGGLWTLGPHIGELGILGHLGNVECPQELGSGSWKYRVGATWFLDQHINMNCVDEKEVKDNNTNIDNQSNIGAEKKDEQVIKGKFTMKTMPMDRRVEDSNSTEFKQMSTVIESGIMNMLTNDEDLGDKVNFEVSVEQVKVDNGEVDFKIVYNMKDSFVAVPFELQPANMSNILHKDFKLRKGILFEQFPVDSGSFECSGSDPCSQLSCSHKCGYDYNAEKYVCTCPDNMVLDTNGSICLDTNNKNVDYATTAQEATTSKTTSNCSSRSCKDIVSVDDEMTTIKNVVELSDDVTTTTYSTEDITTEMTTPSHHHHHLIVEAEDDHYKYHPHKQQQSQQSNNKKSTQKKKSNKSRSTTLPSTSTRPTTTTTFEPTSTPTTTSRNVFSSSIATSSSASTTVATEVQAGVNDNSISNFLLPVYLPPHHHHDRTRPLINYHGIVPPSSMSSNTAIGAPVTMVSMDVNDNEINDEESDSGKMFMFDCIKAVNNDIEKSVSQEILKCKMTDRGDSDDVFIVVEKSALKTMKP